MGFRSFGAHIEDTGYFLGTLPLRQELNYFLFSRSQWWVRWIVMLIGGGAILAMIFYSLKSAHGG